MTLRRLPLLDPRIPHWDRASLLKRECPFCGSHGEDRFVRPDDLHVRVCARCGLFFVSPLPSEEALSTFYGTYYASHSCHAAPDPCVALGSTPAADFRIVEISSYGSLAGKRVLDVGCGYGAVLARFLQLGAQVSGVDLDPDAVRFAREKLHLSGVVQGALCDIPRDRPFDIICMLDFIEHPPDPFKDLREAASLLAPGGMLAMWTPNAAEAMQQEEPIVFRVDLEHMQYLTPRTCGWMATELGLQTLHVESVGFPGLDRRRRAAASATRKYAASVKRTLRRLPGWKMLSRIKVGLLQNRIPDIRSGTYHLFCILKSSG